MHLRSALEQAIDGHRNAILAFTRDLVAIATENPPGALYRECADRIGQELERLGLDYDVIEASSDTERPRSNLLAFVGGGKPTLYFHGHYDVVPAQHPDLFTPRVRQGHLYGRGSSDMKGGLACMIYATHVLGQLAVPLRGRIGLCIVPDEETGGEGGSAALDRLGLLGKDAIAMLTPEPTSGAIWNANRGAVSLEVTVKGQAAHVGLQHQGVNAFEQMLKVAAALQGLKAEVEGRKTRYTIRPDAAAYSILMLGGQVAGGANFNVVPDECTFTVDRRFNPEEDLDTEKARLFDVLDRLRQQGIEVEADVLQEGPSAGTSDDDPAARVLAETAAAVTGEQPAFEMCPGLLENRWYARKGIPAFAYGPGLLEVSHGPHESIEIDRIYEYTLIYALVAARLLG